MVTLPEKYKPTEKEPYMNPVMIEYFRQKLVDWKAEILKESGATLQDRQRKLISKIDEALERIENGEYGFCEETGDPIGIKRLEARPVATLSIEAQERHERRERTQRDERE